MRTRIIIVFVVALSLLSASPILAKPFPEPFDASQGSEWGRGAETNSLNGIYVSPYDRNDCRDPRFRNPPEKPFFTTRNIVQQTFCLIDANRHVAEKIEIPLLMILTRDDQVVDWKAAADFFERIGSTDKTLKFYDTSGHALTLDRDWESVTDDIVTFVQSLPHTPPS